MSQQDTPDLIADIYADASADLDELTRLRARIDQVQGDVSESEQPDDIVVAASKSFDVTRILVEQGIYKTRHRGRDDIDQSRLRSVVVANVAYLQATLSALPDKTPPE